MKHTLHRILAIVLILSTILVVLGCSNNPRSEEGNLYYRTGSKGLEMRFAVDSPPYSVYEGDQLVIGIEMFNRGTSPIQVGKLYITGYDPNIIRRDGEFDAGNIPVYGMPETFVMNEHKTQYNEEGGYNYLEFYSSTIRLPEGTDIYKIPLTVYACYMYETIASGSICVDPQPHRTSADKACLTTGVTMGGTQGAPVAVTYVDVTNLKESLRLSFHISNVGGGTIYNQYDYNNYCTTIPPVSYNKVNVEYITVGGVEYLCNDQTNPVNLYNGNGYYVCEIPMAGATSAYTTPVEIKLTYAYRDYITKNVHIKNI